MQEIPGSGFSGLRFAGKMVGVTVVMAILSIILMLVGLVGVVLPLLPGVPLAWLGLLIYGIVTDFEKVSILATVIFFVLMLFTFALDLLAPMLGATKYRASKWGVIGVFLGFVIGIIAFGLPGVIIGPLLGALVGELLAGKKTEQAIKSAFGAMIGFLACTLFKMTVVLIILGYFILSLFK